MQLDYKLLNDNTLMSKFSEGVNDITLLFNFVSPREIHATSLSFNRERHENSITLATLKIEEATDPQYFVDMQKRLAGLGGAPLGGFLKA